MIKVTQLNKYFNRRKRNEIHVLNQVSLDFPDKGLIVLLGASGSGKTTLLNVIGGLDKVQSGSILFDDIRIDSYHAETWDRIRNESIGYIFQNYNLLPELSVFDNIAFVLKLMGIRDPKVIDERVNYILKSVGMHPFRKKKAFQLSGGQMQRVAIARALVKNPKVVIADEPTGNLDSKNTIEIMNIIKEISKQKLVVLVTHEKEIARVYGDRIIEIVDGAIQSVIENDKDLEHNIDHDDAIYLKDLNQLVFHEDSQVQTTLYSDQKEESPFHVKLIVKNKTLYIDVESPYQKIKVVNDNANILIKNEHYQKKTKEELQKTGFDLSIFDNQNVARESTRMVSLKQTFIMAFQKLVRTSIKGKMMLISFIVSGIMIALAVSSLAAVAIINPESRMQYPRGYVAVGFETSTRWSLDELMALNTQDDAQFFINPYQETGFFFNRPTSDSPDGMFSAMLDHIDHAETTLIMGRLPLNRYELVVSKGIADELTKKPTGQTVGIWSYQHLLYEKVLHDGVLFDIVGIASSEVKVVYLAQDTAQFFHRLYYLDALETMPASFFDQTLLTHGKEPQEGEILVRKDFYQFLFEKNPEGAFPQTALFLNQELIISGVFEAEGKHPAIVMPSQDIYRHMVESSYRLAIYVQNPALFVKEHGRNATLNLTDVYQDTYDSMAESNRVALISTMTTSAVLIGLATLAFYFIIRSSMVERIYQISVYRALGVRRVDIARSFLIEVFVITTVTTVLGYVLASIAISRLQEGLLGELRFFYINPLTFILGLLLAYLINLYAGMAPVAILLRKTPAQIISQYDI